MKKFILVDRFTLEARAFDTAHNVSLFFWGKDVHSHVIIKDENRVIKLAHSEIRDIERQLEIS